MFYLDDNTASIARAAFPAYPATHQSKYPSLLQRWHGRGVPIQISDWRLASEVSWHGRARQDNPFESGSVELASLINESTPMIGKYEDITTPSDISLGNKIIAIAAMNMLETGDHSLRRIFCPLKRNWPIYVA